MIVMKGAWHQMGRHAPAVVPESLPLIHKCTTEIERLRNLIYCLTLYVWGVRLAIRQDVMVYPVIATLEGARRSSPAT